ncbi:hypothetical protein C8R47DRAFT_1122089 [Mycena vitilis]|nr:hypothetical protein C8R47DRAFT_1122089 [Mycena vitilis]
MSYGYPGQQGQSSQYPDDYVSPRDSNYQPQQSQQPWEQQQQESQHSQHSQVSDMSQQALEQALEQPQQHHQPLSLPPPTPHFQQLEEPQRLVPSTQIPRGTHDLTPIRLHPPGRSPPVEIQPVMLQVDTAVRSTTRPASRARHQYHPYQRPASASESSAAAQRREIEAHHHVRFASQANTPQGSALQSPAAGRQTFAPSELTQPGQQQSSQPFASPISELTHPRHQGASLSGSPLAAFAPFVPLGPEPTQQASPTDGRRYIIRTDTHYDSGTRVFTALLELPGMKKSDLRIALATTPFNRVRQLSVSGTSRAPFPAGSTAASGPALRERKYGRFARAFPVPADTKPEDVDAAMEDGVLVLRVSCGVPAASADEREIPIR